MLTQDQVNEYFKTFNIPLRDNVKLTDREIDILYLQAEKLGYSFSSFINMIVINADKTGIETNFENEEEIYESYCAFMSGFCGIKC